MKIQYVWLIQFGFILLLLLTGLKYSNSVESSEFIVDEVEIEILDEIKPTIRKELEDFLNDVGFRESGNRYGVVNSYGYLGKFQFSPHLLRRLGFTVTREEFLSSPELQEEAMITLLNHNKHVLRRVIELFDGQTFDELIYGVDSCYIETYTVTTSGILAAAHLIGPYRTRLFLEQRIVSRDGYGTTVTEYLYSFSGYNLNL